MCGFVGYVSKGNINKKIIKAMADKIAHRGPDSDGYYVDENIALGFRRLSIIDLSTGTQPIYNEDQTKLIMFNGEIYNYQEIKQELLAKGHHFQTESDTEVLLHGYEEYGSKLLMMLRGMFAFVIYDIKNHKLFGARDIFGIKPFYYYQKDDNFIFGSEIKSFLMHPDFEKEFNETRLPDYLTFEYIPGAETFFKNVFKLLPGHYFEYENNELKISRYYEIKYDIDQTKDLTEYQNEIKKIFTESVKAHCIADVEIGCFLSSGVDSSYVAKEISDIAKVKSFSVGFDDEKISEIPPARDFAKSIELTNYSKVISADEYFDAIPKCQYYMDEPLPNVSAIPLYFVAAEAAKHVKVVLSGEGADELFGGYHTYQEPFMAKKYQKIPFFIRKALKNMVTFLPDFHGKNLLLKIGSSIEERYIGVSTVYDEKERAKILKNKYQTNNHAYYTKFYYDKVKDLDDVTKMQYLDMHMWMVYDILLKADKMSMAHSLELRVPFLDKEVLDLALKIPSQYRVSDAKNKIALREAAKERIGNDASSRPKLSFPVPLSEWLKRDKYFDLVKTKFNSLVAQKYFKIKYLNKILDDHKKGNALNMKKIMTIYTFIVWYESYFD